jgi:4a-hydroxytetrahydrobiopterin dehydratase
MARPLLTDEAIEAGLRALPEWKRDGDAIVRRAVLADFRAAQRVLDRVADLAEGANHHPEVEWVYNRLTIRFTTHDSGGITALDLRLAGLVEHVLGDV